MDKIEFECVVAPEDILIEDKGEAKIAELYPTDDNVNGIWVKLQSWCETCEDHPEFDALIKPYAKYKVTIEKI